MADDQGSAAADAEEAATATDEAESMVTSVTPTTIDAADGTDPPVAELTADDDLFAVAEALMTEGLMSDEPGTDIEQVLETLQARCPDAFAGFDQPVGAPVLFDGASATLVISTSPTNQAMVITRACSVLAADQRP